MRRRFENEKVKCRRNPKDDVENEGAEIFREHDLPVTHGRSHEWFDGAEFKLFREEPHGDERKNENESEPKEDRVKECILNRVRDRPLIHKRDLHVEIESGDDQEKNEDDV